MTKDELKMVLTGMEAALKTRGVMKQVIFFTIADLVSSFLYHDRKEDEELPRGAIDKAVNSGEITVDEMVAHFREELTKHLT